MEESLCKSREHSAGAWALLRDVSEGVCSADIGKPGWRSPNHQSLLKILAVEVGRLAIMKGK